MEYFSRATKGRSQMITGNVDAETMDHTELVRRAAMLQEAANAFPPGTDRDRLLLQVLVLEERLRATALRPATISGRVEVDAAA